MPPDPIAAGLVAAYRGTDYVVDAPDGSLVLRAGVPSDRLCALMRALRVDTAAVLTACNPWSRPTDGPGNVAAQRELEAELAARGVPMLAAEGRDPSGSWPSEASVLAFGLPRDAAVGLALRYRQNAFVWIGAPGAPCELAFTRPTAGDPPDGRSG